MTSKDQKHLLVDGYNIAHAWPEMKRILNKSIDALIDELFKSMQVIHDIEHLRLTIIFDGNERGVKLVRPTQEPTLSIIFSPKGNSADGIIQQLVENTKKRSLCQVATDDTALKRGIRDLGAEAISSQDLKYWVEQCEKRQSVLVKEIGKKAKREWKQKP